MSVRKRNIYLWSDFYLGVNQLIIIYLFITKPYYVKNIPCVIYSTRYEIWYLFLKWSK